MAIKMITGVSGLRGKRVLLRCDFNVPLLGNGRIDDYKIIRSLPTIRYVVAKGARVILMTHFGRPGGKEASKYELTAIRAKLVMLLGKNVTYIHDYVGGQAQAAAAKLKDGQIMLLENVRFYPAEEKDDRTLAKQLAGLGDVYVNDAFGSSHRAHVSVSAIQRYLPACAGLLLGEEITQLRRLSRRPRHPFVVVLGGAKLETKLPVIKNLSKQADAVLVGGMLAYDFLAARGLSTGKYKVDAAAKKVAAQTLRRHKNIITPVDFVASRSQSGRGADQLVVSADALPANAYQLDIGPETIRLYARHLKSARTILWNGPLGMVENEHFRHGTSAIARLVASHSRGPAFGLAGGGETITALRQVQMLDDVDWVSTGGGAMLTFLAGGKMPGLRGIIK